METNEKQPVDLPENAFRELKPSEEYKPILSPEKVYPEVNAWSVSWGIVMAVIFSAAAAFLGLESRPSIRSRHTYRHNSRRTIGSR